MEPGCDQPGEMGHIDEEIGAGLVGDVAEAGEIDGAGIGRAAGDDHLRPVRTREIADLVEIDRSTVAGDAIGDDA